MNMGPAEMKCRKDEKINGVIYAEALQKKLPEEQTFYLFILMIFTGFWGKRSGTVGTEKFTYHNFCRIIQDIQRYDTKEAAFRLGEKIDWMLLKTDEELEEAVQAAYEEILEKAVDSGREYLDFLLDSVLELAETTGGYITTPRNIRRLVGDLLCGIHPEKVADFCCGLSVFGIDMCRSICQKTKGGLSQISLYGAETDPVLCAAGTMLMELYGIQGRIEQRDILVPPSESEMQLYDLIVLDMPRGTNKREVYDPRDPRLAGFGGRTVYADWILIQDVLYHLKDGGYAAVLCTTGALIRANEKPLREHVIRQDWLEAVITLPPNLYPNTRTGTELLIFHKGKTGERREKILFVDISRYYFRERRNAYAVSDEGHRAACACCRKFICIEGEETYRRNPENDDIERICYENTNNANKADNEDNSDNSDKVSIILPCDALDRQTCSWKPIQYIHQEMEMGETGSVCLADIADIVRGAQIVKKDTQNAGKMVYFLNIRDIQEGTVRYETAEKISANNAACKDKYRIREDDILITSKGNVVKMAIVGADPPSAFISGNITMIRVRKPAYDPYVLFHYLDSKKGRASLEQIQSGTTIRILNNMNLMALGVPQYSVEKMQEIGSRLKEKREAFLKKQRLLIEDYDTERKILLDLLKEER